MIGTFCRPCWLDYWHPKRHKKCRDRWQDGKDSVVCMCACVREDRALVAQDGEGRRRRAAERITR